MTEEPQVYQVVIAMNLKASSAGDAVAGMVDLLVERGLRAWTYRADLVNDDNTTTTVGTFDGYGESRETISAPTVSVEMPTLSTPVVTVAEVRRGSSEDSDTVAADDDLTGYAAQVIQE